MSNFQQSIDHLDAIENPLTEMEVFQTIKNMDKTNFTPEEIDKHGMESVAFCLFLRTNTDHDYYVQIYTQVPDGRISNYVRYEFEEENILYWTERANKAKHPVLKNRYASLAWDFSKNIKNRGKIAKEMAEISIVSILDMANKQLHADIYEQTKLLKLAHNTALSIGSKEHIRSSIECMLKYQKEVINVDHGVEAWGMSYDSIIRNKRAKIHLIGNEAERIIAYLETQFEYLSNIPARVCISQINYISERLLEYVRNDSPKLHQAARRYVDTGMKLVNAKAHEPIIQLDWLKKMQDLINFFNLSGNKFEFEKEITLKREDISPNILPSLKSGTVYVKIDQKTIDVFFESMTAGSFIENITKWTNYFTLRKADINAVVVQMQANVFSMTIPIHVIDNNTGRSPFIIEDKEAHLMQKGVWSIQTKKIFMRQSIERILHKDNITADEIIDLLYKSSFFENDRKAIIKSGIEAYLCNHPIASTHILIPQIENVVRTILKSLGKPIFKPNNVGGDNLIILDKMLDDDDIKERLGEDAVFYFKTLLTNPKGLNLRNIVCHGLAPSTSFDMGTADFVFHALLVLSLVKEGAR